MLASLLPRLITDANVANLDIAHAWVGDLAATLTSPTGTTVQLFDGPGMPASQYGCDGDDLLCSFDDAAALTATDFENMCNGGVPTISGDFQSMDPMSNFNGESITGTWTLTIVDSYPTADDGVLNAWSLQLCVNPPCNEPDVPTATGGTTICEGNSVTLAVSSGNLNEATDWAWYSGSCGGTFISNGTSIVVSPTVSTSYFVRGEGGCSTPGVCEQVDVIVSPVYNETAAANICDGDTYTFGAQTLTSAGSYTELFSSVNGCDSTVILTLTVNPT
jgi:subtilisin-like proprotein convertase family protein